MVTGKAKPSKAAEGARCRRHPRHRQGAGVCAFCLRERLSRLSTSASLPSVVRGEEGAGASSSCSEASTAYSSEGSTGCSSAAAASSGRASPGFCHDEMRRAGPRVSLLMRHERVVGDADAVAAFLQARREQRRTTAATSFWAKLLHAMTRGGGANRRQDDGCSLAHSKTTLQERVAAAKWVLF